MSSIFILIVGIAIGGWLYSRHQQRLAAEEEARAKRRERRPVLDKLAFEVIALMRQDPSFDFAAGDPVELAERGGTKYAWQVVKRSDLPVHEHGLAFVAVTELVFHHLDS